MVYDLIIAGGGAAGFFAAVEAATQNPALKIVILEKSTKLLSKVKISGGGRCNVTHHCFEPTPLSKHYPRGQREFKQLFRIFQASDTVNWFEKRGVKLKTEDDGRMFPVTDDSQSIIDCFLREAEKFKIEVRMTTEVDRIERNNDRFTVHCRNGKSFSSIKFLIAMGGPPKEDSYEWIKSLGHTILPPIPSLFTFNDSSKEFTDLMGVAVQDGEVKIAGTNFSSRGPVLITHWGLSGPAVIKLSAWAALHLHEVHYQFVALVNWTGDQTEVSVRNVFSEKNLREGGKRILSQSLFKLPQRLWEKICSKAEVSEKVTWAEAPSKTLNRLLEFLIRCPFHILGKTTFKEEFVTSGGVDLKEIELATMESKKVPGLYFAGEVMNVDGETGGFNFQAAWTTAFVAARSVARSSREEQK